MYIKEKEKEGLGLTDNHSGAMNDFSFTFCQRTTAYIQNHWVLMLWNGTVNSVPDTLLITSTQQVVIYRLPKFSVSCLWAKWCWDFLALWSFHLIKWPSQKTTLDWMKYQSHLSCGRFACTEILCQACKVLRGKLDLTATLKESWKVMAITRLSPLVSMQNFMTASWENTASHAGPKRKISDRLMMACCLWGTNISETKKERNLNY